MGDRYFYGRGVEQDYAKAFGWYRKAAAQGFAEAQHNVGALYENGWGVTKDIEQAKVWYQMAAIQGDAFAQAALQRLEANVAPTVTAAQPAQPEKSTNSESSLSAAQERALRPGDSFKECGDCPEMIVVPAGRFMMGSPEGQGHDNERPQHEVTIAKPFAVAKFD
jgi:TPR repeat protein